MSTPNVGNPAGSDEKQLIQIVTRGPVVIRPILIAFGSVGLSETRILAHDFVAECEKDFDFSRAVNVQKSKQSPKRYTFSFWYMKSFTDHLVK